MNSELHRFFLKETQKHHIRNGSKKDGDEGLVFPFVGDKTTAAASSFGTAAEIPPVGISFIQ